MKDQDNKVIKHATAIETRQAKAASSLISQGESYQAGNSASGSDGPGTNTAGPELVTPLEDALPTGHGQLAHRRAAGPRTELGKQRSSRNATKYGIFSEVVVLKGESRAEYQSLLKGLWEAFQPEGKLEEVLVEKLAIILWRHRRLIVAEGAEIRKNIEFLEWDRRSQQQEQAEEIGSSSVLDYNGGLIRKIQNPNVLERCLELLAELRQAIEIDGFDPEQDTPILAKIYGGSDRSRLRENSLRRLCDLALHVKCL